MEDTVDGVASSPDVADPIQERTDDIKYPTWQPECRAVMLEIDPYMMIPSPCFPASTLHPFPGAGDDVRHRSRRLPPEQPVRVTGIRNQDGRISGTPRRRMAWNSISGRVVHRGEHFFDAVALAGSQIRSEGISAIEQML